MDRNSIARIRYNQAPVALRKESVDRNFVPFDVIRPAIVALRKESVDRNYAANAVDQILPVALRKESVDRKVQVTLSGHDFSKSLSARRAWIEIRYIPLSLPVCSVALRKESVDRNSNPLRPDDLKKRRSPQGERG